MPIEPPGSPSKRPDPPDASDMKKLTDSLDDSDHSLGDFSAALSDYQENEVNKDNGLDDSIQLDHHDSMEVDGNDHQSNKHHGKGERDKKKKSSSGKHRKKNGHGSSRSGLNYHEDDEDGKKRRSRRKHRSDPNASKSTFDASKSTFDSSLKDVSMSSISENQDEEDESGKKKRHHRSRKACLEAESLQPEPEPSIGGEDDELLFEQTNDQSMDPSCPDPEVDVVDETGQEDPAENDSEKITDSTKPSGKKKKKSSSGLGLGNFLEKAEAKAAKIKVDSDEISRGAYSTASKMADAAKRKKHNTQNSSMSNYMETKNHLFHMSMNLEKALKSPAGAPKSPGFNMSLSSLGSMLNEKKKIRSSETDDTPQRPSARLQRSKSYRPSASKSPHNMEEQPSSQKQSSLMSPKADSRSEKSHSVRRSATQRTTRTTGGNIFSTPHKSTSKSMRGERSLRSLKESSRTTRGERSLTPLAEIEKSKPVLASVIKSQQGAGSTISTMSPLLNASIRNMTEFIKATESPSGPSEPKSSRNDFLDLLGGRKTTALPQKSTDASRRRQRKIEMKDDEKSSKDPPSDDDPPFDLDDDPPLEVHDDPPLDVDDPPLDDPPTEDPPVDDPPLDLDEDPPLDIDLDNTESVHSDQKEDGPRSLKRRESTRNLKREKSMRDVKSSRPIRREESTRKLKHSDSTRRLGSQPPSRQASQREEKSGGDTPTRQQSRRASSFTSTPPTRQTSRRASNLGSQPPSRQLSRQSSRRDNNLGLGSSHKPRSAEKSAHPRSLPSQNKNEDGTRGSNDKTLVTSDEWAGTSDNAKSMSPRSSKESENETLKTRHLRRLVDPGNHTMHDRLDKFSSLHAPTTGSNKKSASKAARRASVATCRRSSMTGTTLKAGRRSSMTGTTLKAGRRSSMTSSKTDENSASNNGANNDFASNWRPPAATRRSSEVCSMRPQPPSEREKKTKEAEREAVAAVEAAIAAAKRAGLDVDIKVLRKMNDTIPISPRRRTSNQERRTSNQSNKSTRRSSDGSHLSHRSKNKSNRRSSAESLTENSSYDDDFAIEENSIPIDEVETKDDFGQVPDIFTLYSWSTAKQDPNEIQRERECLRSLMRDTALDRAFVRFCRSKF